MGLSEFEECSSPIRYCCPSIDRPLTISLIESSNSLPKGSSQFAHRLDWVEGLDRWMSVESSSAKCDLARRHVDFHQDLGLYLPRHEKPSSAPISTKNLQLNGKPAAATTSNFAPERIRQLIKKEKDLLLETHSSDQQVNIEKSLPPVPANTFRQSASIDSTAANEVRLSLRHITNQSSSPGQQQQINNPSLNQDTLKTLLKEHLTSLLTRGASTLNGGRTFVNVPSVEVKSQVRPDLKYVEERCSKLEELSTPTGTPPAPTLQQQTKAGAAVPFAYIPRPTLGLTVTPVDLSAQKNFQSVSLEKMAQQKVFSQDNDCSSVSSSRPSTQPAPLPSSTHQYHQQQKAAVRRNLETTNSSSIENLLANDSLLRQVEQSSIIQNVRKVPQNSRSSSKTGMHRMAIPTTTTLELLPPIISGKRLHIPIGNHRYL